MNRLGEYLELHAPSDTLLLPGVFNKLQNMYLEIYGLDPAHFIAAPGFAWQTALKKTKVKVDILININMFLLVVKVTEVEYFMLFLDL